MSCPIFKFSAHDTSSIDMTKKISKYSIGMFNCKRKRELVKISKTNNKLTNRFADLEVKCCTLVYFLCMFIKKQPCVNRSCSNKNSKKSKFYVLPQTSCFVSREVVHVYKTNNGDKVNLAASTSAQIKCKI